MAADGTHGVGRALDVLSVYDRQGCDVIGLQGIRRSGHSAFTQAGYLVYCSGECGSENDDGTKGQYGVGLAVRTSITRAARPPELINDRLMKGLHLNHVIEPRPLHLLWRIPKLKHRMLVTNMHSGRPWIELCRRHLNTNICSC